MAVDDLLNACHCKKLGDAEMINTTYDGYCYLLVDGAYIEVDSYSKLRKLGNK